MEAPTQRTQTIAARKAQRPLPKLLGNGERAERNRLAAESELATMRVDAIQYLQMVAQQHGNDGIRSLLVEAIPAWAPLALGATVPVEQVA